jgi:GNAT superfamily N-acetyltransferase
MNIAERLACLPAGDPADRLRWRDGSLRDYAALSQYHYLRHAPVTATRVLVLEDDQPGVGGRFTRRAEAPRVVGVLVESLPALSCALRNAALADRHAGWSDRAAAARLLNAEVRCISRVVVHPQWRGLGLAVRLVRRALATMTTPYTEALAAMGRVHPFFELAGMTAYHRWPLPRDQRLLDALRSAGIEPWQLASRARMRQALAGPAASLLKRELARWAGPRLEPDAQLARAREQLLCQPVYYLRRRPD